MPSIRSIRLALIALCSTLLLAAAQANGEKAEAKRILILGDSLTAGYGIDPSDAYPARLQKIIDQKDLPYRIIASGLSGETSAGGLRRVDWVLRQPIDMLILALGANDGLRGIDLADTKRNLQAIIDKVRAKSPGARIVIAGMQIPPNMGPDYTKRFRQIFPQLAEENDAHLIPFLLADVGGRSELNLPDGIHPNAQGHSIVAQNVWNALRPLLEPDPS